MKLWRISNHVTLDGEGGRRSPARWNSGGDPVVYLAASAPGALLELLVHLELSPETLPPSYTLLTISIPATLRIPALRLPREDTWRTDLTVTRALGDKWLASRRSALTRIPSVILPSTFNYLLNPLHPDARKINIVDVTRGLLDPRLLRTTK